jgi:hypothetical protein
MSRPLFLPRKLENFKGGCHRETNNKLDYSTLNSFCPISLVGNLSKILEKIILGRLNWIGQNLEWFSQNQHGFRESHSTETAAHSLTSFIESASMEKKRVWLPSLTSRVPSTQPGIRQL